MRWVHIIRSRLERSIDTFLQVLEEDSSVNRIVDSLDIWRQIVTNPLLYKTSLVLFLNSECLQSLGLCRKPLIQRHIEMDILQYKLRSGKQIKQYFPDYDKSNDYEGEASSVESRSDFIFSPICPFRRSLALLSRPIPQGRSRLSRYCTFSQLIRTQDDGHLHKGDQSHS
jgi:hypothetical protein